MGKNNQSRSNDPAHSKERMIRGSFLASEGSFEQHGIRQKVTRKKNEPNVFPYFPSFVPWLYYIA